MRVTRTYLELKDRPQFKAAFGDFPDVRVVRAARPRPELYRMCYQIVGEAFHWRDRWGWTDAQIAEHLADPAIHLFVATRQNGKQKAHLAGWYELRRVIEDDSVEIAYFGIVAAEFGRGFGKHLLSSAVRDAWALAPKRVWLHTCTLDHPNALPNYLARGFTPYRTETYEVDSAP
ncbi:MAG TPA: GNAT family N-acetyltransferase [Gemmatimonadales bacterium]|nr:GNAT family N-acetyltransferase [Gemmatimonadales bacterium]